MQRFAHAGLAAMLVTTLLVPAALAQEPGDEVATVGSDNLTLVSTHDYARNYGEPLASGSDTEFATLEVLEGAARVRRVDGPRREATAAAISQQVHPAFQETEQAILARSDVYADALAGATLAAELGAPVLLTPGAALADATRLELGRLGVTSVTVLGGDAAIGPAVIDALTDLGIETTRLAGENRYETAALIAGELADTTTAVLVEGANPLASRGWPDALSAAQLGRPILLTEQAALPTATADALRGRDVTIVGGRAAVGTSVEAGVRGISSSVERLGGATRYETNALVVAAALADGAMVERTWVAVGTNFPDGLAAGAAAATQGGVLLLTDGENISPTATAHVTDHEGEIKQLLLAGGPAVLTDNVQTDLTELLGDDVRTRDYAILGSYANGIQIADITDPAATEIVTVYDCATAQSDIQVFTREDRTYFTVTNDGGFANEKDPSSTCYRDLERFDEASGTFIADITNPFDIRTMGFVDIVQGSHNNSIHPSGEYLYSSNSDLVTSVANGPPAIELVDIRDLRNPTKIGEITLPTQPAGLGTESHDVTFSADGTRGYSAALSQTVILDTTDPADPTVISQILDPQINVHHQSDPVTVDGVDYLVITDELAGAAGSPCPGGGLHVWDISDESLPVKVGYWAIPEFRPAGAGSGSGESLTCTSHVLRFHEDEQVMTIAWYNAGVWVVDISDIAGIQQGVANSETPLPGMRTLGFRYFENSDTWSAKTNRINPDGSFHLYGNDILRGLDVYHYVPDASAVPAAFRGTWVGRDDLHTLPTRSVEQRRAYEMFCLLGQNA